MHPHFFRVVPALVVVHLLTEVQLVFPRGVEQGGFRRQPAFLPADRHVVVKLDHIKSKYVYFNTRQSP